MINQDIKSGLFGSIGENMVAFELAKRNWYVYRPYFDTRIDFIAQKFVCRKCFSDWESKHIVTCSNVNCDNNGKDLNQKEFVKNRKCLEESCGYIFNKYSIEIDCPKCNASMSVNERKSPQGQRNYYYTCQKCGYNFTSQTRKCVKCESENCVEYPTCKSCGSEIKPSNAKCSNPDCGSYDYALIIRTLQVKSSHEESSGTVGFNFKLQDLIDDERHFLVVYTRTFEEYLEKHNYWVMSVDEFKNEYVKDNASTLVYQNNRLHPPKTGSKFFFDERQYNKLVHQLHIAKEEGDTESIISLKNKISEIDVFGKLNRRLKGDF
jgi:hypothetical protein